MLRFTRMTCIPPNKDGDSVTKEIHVIVMSCRPPELALHWGPGKCPYMTGVFSSHHCRHWDQTKVSVGHMAGNCSSGVCVSTKEGGGANTLGQHFARLCTFKICIIDRLRCTNDGAGNSLGHGKSPFIVTSSRFTRERE